jgi:hypothetical protein
MDVDLCGIFDESIKLEGNVADLYVMFQDTLPQDADLRTSAELFPGF